jgi:hypothetical protein
VQHDRVLHNEGHHDPPNPTTARLIISFGRNQRHNRILSHVLRLCTEADLYVEHCTRHPKSWVIEVAGVTRKRLRAVIEKTSDTIVVAYEST